ncbi:ATP-grasp domain-containing protein [Streptomyces coffeae]|uniref:ATP-grasp domain-containing protein n=1 Tax=Streptomyces coffeae TaxID=621382 RepID=A0ABS1NKR6_9ACTN|nr:ATP-grasp domain-containing protein [Streptomyces coffeae]MBL1100636.1 ATP-grasp domain-containing protein [Streptomyces coffeae]
MGPVFLFSRDPLTPRRVDPEFADEARAVRAAGATVTLIDHEALVSGDATGAVARVPRETGPAWYRGWMLPGDRYAELATALAERGRTLLTSPERYRTAHELPGWYAVFAPLTPPSAWLPTAPGHTPAESELARMAARLGGAGPVVVKDWVKSRKHEWDEACYVPETADTGRLAAVVARFVELQGDFLTGGVVLRRFEHYQPVGEARVWWLDGEPVHIGPHPDSPALRPAPDLTDVGPAVRELGCRFITTDLALREDGRWRVVEVGDGQVSGLPRDTDPQPLFTALATAAAR